VFVAVAIGGAIQIIPTIIVNRQKNIEGRLQELYTPLELAGRDIYVSEGCYNCHSQMIRTLVPEVMRYGRAGVADDYSHLGESLFDHPYQWGSKRTGPDLARLGGKYSDQWHVQHLKAPRSVVPQSIMPNYPWLLTTKLDYSDVADRMRALRATGVPYSVTQAEYEANVKKFGQTVADQLDISQAEANLLKEARDKNFDGIAGQVTEMEALVAYLQSLGTMVNFSQYNDDEFVKFR